MAYEQDSGVARSHGDAVRAVGPFRPPMLALAAPCFNEELTLQVMVPRFVELVDGLVASGAAAPGSFALFVDDGSADGTWGVLEHAAAARPDRVHCFRLPENRGQQRALWTALMEVCGACDACITLDCDGQDDLAAVPAMLAAHARGASVVFGERSSRSGDGLLKRASARLYYRLMNAAHERMVFDHAEFRLMDAAVLDALAGLDPILGPGGKGEVFLRGVVPQLGFPSAQVPYERRDRVAGETHYSFAQMVRLALAGARSTLRAPSPILASSQFAHDFGLLQILG